LTGPSEGTVGASGAGSDVPGFGGEPVATEPVAVRSRASHRRAQRAVQGRVGAVTAVAVLVLGVGLTSAVATTTTAPPVPPVGDATTVAPAGTLNSSLYCVTGAGVDAGEGATGMVVLTNSFRTAAVGFVTTVGTTGTTTASAVTVPALGSAVVTPAKDLSVEAHATTYSFAQGGVTGTAVVAGAQGWSTAPCSSQISSQWDFAGGSTNSGLLDLSLYNPTATQAVVNVMFLTSTGTVLDPQAYQGISIPPGKLVVEGLAAYVQDQAVVATLVTATSGALVATELDQMTTASGKGLALMAGSPGPAKTWYFGQTTAVQGGIVTLSVANPGTAPATIEITVGLPAASVVPRRLTVPGRTVAPLIVSAIAGWPLGTPYSMTVSASVPIVVGRTVTAPVGGKAPQGGIVTGTTTTARSWLVVAPGAPGGPPVAGAALDSLAVANPGASPVDVTVARLADGHPIATIRVPALGVVVLGPTQMSGLEPLMVTSSGPVVVETDSKPSGAPGTVSSAGFPFRA
jgi:hypothetical protein